MINIGQTIGDWTILSEEWSDNKRARRIKCRCVCGKEADCYVFRLERGLSLSCGCRRNLRRTRPFSSVYKEIKKRAQKKGREFLLAYEDYVILAQNAICFYCGDTLFWPAYGRRSRQEKPPKGYMASNLDRKNNVLGYTKDNTVTCCGRCNKVKGKYLSFEEMVEVGKILKRFREQKQ